jgi:hypothetical protein
LRNRVAAMVQLDKHMSNASKLCNAKDDPKVLWELANAAVGKERPTLLPSLYQENGEYTKTDKEAADQMNSFYVEKIDKLREKTEDTPVPSPSLSWPTTPSTFNFAFVTTRKIKEVICALKPTEA